MIPTHEKVLIIIDRLLSLESKGMTSLEISEFLDCHQRTARRFINLIVSMSHEFKSFDVEYKKRVLRLYVK